MQSETLETAELDRQTEGRRGNQTHVDKQKDLDEQTKAEKEVQSDKEMTDECGKQTEMRQEKEPCRQTEESENGVASESCDEIEDEADSGAQTERQNDENSPVQNDIDIPAGSGNCSVRTANCQSSVPPADRQQTREATRASVLAGQNDLLQVVECVSHRLCHSLSWPGPQNDNGSVNDDDITQNTIYRDMNNQQVAFVTNALSDMCVTAVGPPADIGAASDNNAFTNAVPATNRNSQTSAMPTRSSRRGAGGCCGCSGRKELAGFRKTAWELGAQRSHSVIGGGSKTDPRDGADWDRER